MNSLARRARCPHVASAASEFLAAKEVTDVVHNVTSIALVAAPRWRDVLTIAAPRAGSVAPIGQGYILRCLNDRGRPCPLGDLSSSESSPELAPAGATPSISPAWSERPDGDALRRCRSRALRRLRRRRPPRVGIIS